MPEFEVGDFVKYQVDGTWRTGVIMSLNDKLAKISLPNTGVQWVPVDVLCGCSDAPPAETVYHGGDEHTNVSRFHFIVMYDGAVADVMGVDAGEMNLSGIGWVPLDDPKLCPFDRGGSEDEEEDGSEPDHTPAQASGSASLYGPHYLGMIVIPNSDNRAVSLITKVTFQSVNKQKRQWYVHFDDKVVALTRLRTSYAVFRNTGAALEQVTLP